MSQPTDARPKTKRSCRRFLDVVERVGNKVPHPVVIFLILIALVLVLSHILFLLGASVSYQVINPETHKLETQTTHLRRPKPADRQRTSRHVLARWSRTSWASLRSGC